MKLPTVSVIMNCYNSEAFLREAIESVIAQTLTNWEIIFWDNCSDDHSAEIANSYRDERIRYFKAERHSNLGGARKLAVEHSRGQFLAFLDCDDLFLPDTLETQLRAIESHTAAVVYGGMTAIDRQGRELFYRSPNCQSGNVFDDNLRQYDAPMATIMIRRSVLIEEQLNFDPEIFGSEEYDLLMHLAVSHDFAVVHRSIAKMRLSRNSLTYEVMDKWATDRERTLDHIRERHPGIERSHRNGFKQAYARANYYRARWHVEEQRTGEALTELRQVMFVDYRYFSLYLILNLSPGLWKWIHNRRASSRNF
jgi:glycosyltransferase involved in cell wall biosynthesis